MRWMSMYLERSPPVLKESWNDSEGVSHVPLQRGGLLTMAEDTFLSLALRMGVSLGLIAEDM